MRIFYRGISTVLICLILGCFFSSHAAALSEDYANLIKKRYELETQRQKYEDSLKKLVLLNKNLTIVFFRCIAKRDKTLWENRIDDAEQFKLKTDSRQQEIEALRKQIDESRKELEKRRAEIEASYKDKGEPSEYEDAFREYMSQLKGTYFKTLSLDLFKAYEEYLSEIEGHISFLRQGINECKNQK